VVEVACKEVCQDISHLEKFFQDVIDKGGEGVILRDPYALPKPGRDPSYLKHKVCLLLYFPRINILFKKYRDAEAKIVKQVNDFQWECQL